MKLFYFILFLVFCSVGSYAQLKSFAVYYNHKDKKVKYLKLKKFPIKVGPNNTLYIHNKLIFEPSGDSTEYYELLDNSYVFISFFDTSYRYQSIGSTLWRKGSVMIISIKDPSRKYFFDIAKRCRSEGVIKFYENEKVLRIKDLNTNAIVDLKVIGKG